MDGAYIHATQDQESKALLILFLEKKWDVFTEDKIELSISEKKYDKKLEEKYKLLKIVTIFSVFCLTLTAGVVQKGVIFFMVSQIGKDVTINTCPMEFPSSLVSHDTRVGVTQTERVGWIWAIFFCFLAAEVFTLIKSCRIMFMKSYSFLEPGQFLIVLALETVHVVGTALLFLVAFPELDSAQAILATTATASIPALLKINCTFQKSTWGKYYLKLIFDILALILQILVFILCSLISRTKPTYLFPLYLILGLFFTSFGWWECYLDEDKKNSKWVRVLAKIRKNMTNGKEDKKYRYEFKNLKKIPYISKWFQHIETKINEKHSARGPTYFFIALWKIVVFFMVMTLLLPNIGIVSYMNALFDEFVPSFETYQYAVYQNNSTVGITYDLLGWKKLWEGKALVIIVQIGSSWILYSLNKLACKSNITRYGFALPMTLVTPVSIWTLYGICYFRNRNPCYHSSSFPRHLFFNCSNLSGWYCGIVLILTFSIIWIACQIWDSNEKGFLLETNHIFSKYYYNGLLVDTSIVLNKLQKKDSSQEDKNMKRTQQRRTPKIYACATMWHENSEEMKTCLKSMFKMDDDYAVRKYRKEEKGDTEDFYEWEAHIFFDDAMIDMYRVNMYNTKPDTKKVWWTDDNSEEEVENQMKKIKDDKSKIVLNDYVVDLIETVKEYGEEWYKKINIDLQPPVKMITPYGGRIEWTLPGGTKLIAHLKDKHLIRRKKRWSQIMYMYYFLGYMLKEKEGQMKDQNDGDNTFILALDGDVDFLPDAVIKVVDILEKNEKIGAACGRIHPTGGGYMTMYQIFEYAIGHWLQKSTEHIFGCVLCSPGCFSLFRGTALMTSNVMKTYSTMATEPQHFIQYDQGEDRWLCTLMLKQGWRIEYTAASDSYTACPQAFGEFYNQRRRWMPSTILNVIDLLNNWNSVVDKNDNISTYYMIYQSFMLTASVIGPGSIILMLIGAFSMAFGISDTLSLIVNVVLVVIYMAACVFLRRDQQIMIAQLLTFIYVIMMIAAYIGICIQIIETGPLSLTALGFFFTFGSFIVAAVFHPQEWTDLFCCVIYVATIPSMYLLLTIYAVFNMNDISWGTREIHTKIDTQKMKRQADDAERKEGIFYSLLYCLCLQWFCWNKSLAIQESFMPFFGPLLSKGSRFSKTDDKKNERRLSEIEKNLSEINSKLDRILYESGVTENKIDKEEDNKGEITAYEQKEKEESLRRNFGYWMENNEENRTRCAYLTEEAQKKKIDRDEELFWTNLIEDYLKPIDLEEGVKERYKSELKDYRNKIALGFVLVNAMWVTAIYMLQAYTEQLGIRWPLGAKGPTLTYDTSNMEMSSLIILTYEYQRVDPIGFVFVLAFIFVIFIQFIGMLFHCVETLEQILLHVDVHEEQRYTKKWKMKPLDLINLMRENLLEEMEKYKESKKIGQGNGRTYRVPKWINKEDERNNPKTMQSKIGEFLEHKFPLQKDPEP